MNIQKIAVCTILTVSLGLSLSSVASSKNYQNGDRNTARINDIINGLEPYKYRSKSYSKRVYKVTPRYNKRPYGSPVIVNFNHSVNLSVFFGHNKADITYRARHILDELGYALGSPRLRNYVYLLAGHTNSKGASGYNQWLSEERAYAVKNYLVRHFNINPNRLVTTGFGEDKPLNRRKRHSAANRRVEIALIETGRPRQNHGHGYDASQTYNRQNNIINQRAP